LLEDGLRGTLDLFRRSLFAEPLVIDTRPASLDNDIVLLLPLGHGLAMRAWGGHIWSEGRMDRLTLSFQLGFVSSPAWASPATSQDPIDEGSAHADLPRSGGKSARRRDRSANPAPSAPRRADLALPGQPADVFRRHSLGSSGSAPLVRSASRRAWYSSKASEMCLRKISPRTTCLYSAAPMLERRASTAGQRSFPKPMVAAVRLLHPLQLTTLHPAIQ
jgi:hypothetical protein